jgi:SAM-dependent methyltransferase
MDMFGLHFRPAEGRLYVHDQAQPFDYSDGHDEEKKLLKIIETISDVSAASWTLQSAIESWAQRYHLSIERGAIIRCLPFSPASRVLELGAGCGAVTRILAETYASVDAVEASPMRATICASRCRDLHNVRVFVADINAINPEPVYDLVLLVGVLEWSKSYVEGADPFKRCLEIACRSLKQDGVLIIAIENQLGIKYFFGIGEDHCGAEMEGLHGYPVFKRVQTFSKAKLANLVGQTGMTSIRFLYPYPDYKLARVVLTDQAVSLQSEAIGYWASRQRFEDYLKPERRLDGNQSLIMGELAKAGLLGELSNSFLLLASRREAGFVNWPWLVWSERPAQNREFYSLTTLEHRDGALSIRKRYPHGQTRERDVAAAVFTLNPLQDQPFVDGSILELELLRLAISSDERLFFEGLHDWLTHIQTQQLAHDDTHVRPEAWDCIPRNLMRLPDGRLKTFDLEFASIHSVGIEAVCTRGLLWWYVENGSWAVSLNPRAKTIREHLSAVLGKLFPRTDIARLISESIEREHQFQSLFAPRDHAATIATFLDTPLIPARSREQCILDLENRLTEMAEQLRCSQDQFKRLKDHVVIGSVIAIWRKWFNSRLP